MATALRCHQAHADPEESIGVELPLWFLPRPSSHENSSEVPADDHRIRRRRLQSMLCQLAWQPLARVQNEADDVLALTDQDIHLECCKSDCRLLLFPDLAYSASGSDPPVLFHSSWVNNKDLFLSIERGQCPCANFSKSTISFLPACAAAAAGNVELFRWLLQTFLTRVQTMYGGGRCPKDYGGKSAVKKETPSARANTRVRFETSKAVHHSDRLLAQALRHLLYAGQAREAVRVLDDPQVQATVHFTDDSKMSLLDLALRLEDEGVFWELVDRWGLHIQSDSDGLTPLLLAVSWGLTSLSRSLLRRGAPRGAVTRGKRSAIHVALRLENREESDKMAMMLLEEGEADDADDPLIPSSLELAIFDKRYAILDYLLQLGQVRVPEKTRCRKAGRTTETLMWSPVVSWCCVRTRNCAMAHYFVERGLDCFTSVVQNLSFSDSDSRTPLQALVENKSDEALRLVDLLIEKGADVNEKTCKGHTPLVLAMKHSNLRVLGKLLCAGAILDSNDRCDETGGMGATQQRSGASTAQSGSGPVSTEIGSESITMQNGSGSASTQNESSSASTQNESSSASTQNGSGSASTQNDSGSTFIQNGLGSTSTQHISGSTTAQSSAGALNSSGSTSTQNESGESTTAQNSSGTAVTQNGFGSVSTQNGSGSTARQNGTGPASTQNISGSASSQNGTGPASTQNISGSASSQNGLRIANTHNSSFLWHAVNSQHYKIAEMAMVGGYRAQREDWYAMGNFPTDTPQDVKDSLERIAQQPMALISLCRRTLRESMRSELSAFLQTHLPQPVKDFIAMKDLVDMYLTPSS